MTQQLIADMRTLANEFDLDRDQAIARAALVQMWIERLTDGGLPYIDRVSEMPTNSSPFHPDFVASFPGNFGWPHRDMSKITGLTIHHTLSHSPIATAQYCTATKGYPTTQYHYWVSADDGCPCYLLAQPTDGLWHDHTGRHPTTLSIGMAGSLHVAKPPGEQIDSAARLIAWLMDEYDIPLGQVKGHQERYAWTVCPGWRHDAANWRDDFFMAVDAMLEKGN